MTKWHGGKGSTQKPYDKEAFDKNFRESSQNLRRKILRTRRRR